MLLLLAATALAADGPVRVGPGTGDHPRTEISWPEQVFEDPFSSYRLSRTRAFDNRHARFGPLPIRWTFDHELAASLALIAPMSLVPDAAAVPDALLSTAVPDLAPAAPATPAPPAP
jgi:hypothetical protein